MLSASVSFCLPKGSGQERVSHQTECQLWENAKKAETDFRQLLTHAKIKKVSGRGLLLAVEFSDTQENLSIVELCINNGYITDWFLFNDKRLRLAPPLIITEKQVNQAAKGILNAIDQYGLV